MASKGETVGGLATEQWEKITVSASENEISRRRARRTEEGARILAKVKDEPTGLSRREPGQEPLISPSDSTAGE